MEIGNERDLELPKVHQALVKDLSCEAQARLLFHVWEKIKTQIRAHAKLAWAGARSH